MADYYKYCPRCGNRKILHNSMRFILMDWDYHCENCDLYWGKEDYYWDYKKHCYVSNDEDDDDDDDDDDCNDDDDDDDDDCKKTYIKNYYYGNRAKNKCHKCGSTNTVYYNNKRLYRCNNCGNTWR